MLCAGASVRKWLPQVCVRRRMDDQDKLRGGQRVGDSIGQARAPGSRARLRVKLRLQFAHARKRQGKALLVPLQKGMALHQRAKALERLPSGKAIRAARRGEGGGRERAWRMGARKGRGADAGNAPENLRGQNGVAAMRLAPWMPPALSPQAYRPAMAVAAFSSISMPPLKPWQWG